MFCYIIIAAVISAVFTSTVFYPEIKDAAESGTVNIFTESQALVLGLVFALSMLVAPVAYAVLLIDSIRAQVSKGIESVVNQD